MDDNKIELANKLLECYIVFSKDKKSGITKPEWIDTISLPENINGGSVVGYLSKVPFYDELKPILKERGYKKYKSHNFLYEKIRSSGNQIILMYDLAPLIKSISCKLIYRGMGWKHVIFIAFAKEYNHPQYGINSIEQLKKVVTNHGIILDNVEKQILNGLDKIYGETPQEYKYPLSGF